MVSKYCSGVALVEYNCVGCFRLHREGRQVAQWSIAMKMPDNCIFGGSREAQRSLEQIHKN